MILRNMYVPNRMLMTRQKRVTKAPVARKGSKEGKKNRQTPFSFLKTPLLALKQTCLPIFEAPHSLKKRKNDGLS